MDEFAFLSTSPALTTGRHILHIYRSGRFRREVRARVFALAQTQGWGIEAAPTLDALRTEISTASLIPAVFAYQAEHARERAAEAHASDRCLEALEAAGEHIAFLCLPHTSPLLARPLWSKIAAQALMIEELPVTAQTVDTLLDGLMRWAPWYDFARLHERGRLMASLRARCLEEEWTLPQLVQAFQWTALSGGIDFVNDRCRTDLADACDEATPARVITPKLESFLSTLDDGALGQLVRLVDERRHRQGQRPDEIVAALHRSAATLLRRSTAQVSRPRRQGRAETKEAPWRVLLAWCALLLIHEDEAHLNPSLFVDLLGRRCRTLVRRDMPADVSVLSWTRMASRLTQPGPGERAALRAARDRLHAALSATMQARDSAQDDRFIGAARAVITRTWAARATARDQAEAADALLDVEDTPARDQGEPTSPAHDEAGLSYTRFAQVPGCRGAVAQLQILAAEPTAPAVLLEGPPGSGRRAVARLFARAIQCESATHAPCGLCEACHRFSPTPGEVNYLEGSAATLDEAHLRTFIDGAEQSLPFHRYSILIITEAEAAVGPLLDFTLKRLETEQRKVAFVFITADQRRMRDTIVSRCTTLTLERLSAADSCAFLHQVETSSGRPLASGARALIAAAAGGLVDGLHRGHAAATARPNAGPHDILEAMHQAWGVEAGADWDTITVGATPAASPLPVAQRVQHLRRLLLDLRLRGLESPPVPALAIPALAQSTSADGTERVARLRTVARHLGVTPEVLWSELARRWSMDTVREPVGLSMVFDETRRLYTSAHPKVTPGSDPR